MSKIYKVKATLSYLCVADNYTEALEQFADYCELIHIQAKDFDDVYFDDVAKEVPEEDE